MDTDCFGITHLVEQGESLWSISNKYDTTLDDIIALNPNIDPYNLTVGEKICITKNEESTNIQTKESLTYVFGNTSSYYLESLSKTKNSIQTLCPDFFEISDDGNLVLASTDKLNFNFIQELKNENIKVTPFLTNNWDRTKGELALDNRENLSNQIVDAISLYELDGVNIDIENVTDLYKNQYTDFVKLLKEKLPENKIISVAVAANPNGWTTGWHGSYDYKALSNYSDYLMIMAYDESYQGGPEGPVSSIDFFNSSIDYALNQEVPKDKIVAGIPFFGRYWKVEDTTGGFGIANSDVEFLLKNYTGESIFDETTKSAFAKITIKSTDTEPTIFGNRKLSAGTYNIWYDSEESTYYKLKSINNYDIKGAGSWALGQEITNIWDFYTNVLNGNSDINGGNIDLDTEKIINTVYPVGSIYMSVNNLNPTEIFGGTWISWGNGKVIVGVNENDYNGKFNTSEMVGGSEEHRHDFKLAMHWWYGAATGENTSNGTGAYRYSNNTYDGWYRSVENKSMPINNANYNTRADTIDSPNGRESIGNTDIASSYPPYITCYFWKRMT